jgi:hypothetical protein
MFALVRVALLSLCLAGLFAAGCGPAVTSSTSGTPSNKTPTTNGKPKQPVDDRG